MLNNYIKGNLGEEIAATFLLDKHYEILEKKYRTIIGEIDIIARHNDYIVFIEVKYRKNIDCGYPREAVTRNKQKKILRVAQFYIMENNLDNCDFRFDVIEILGYEDLSITHLENAFT